MGLGRDGGEGQDVASARNLTLLLGRATYSPGSRIICENHSPFAEHTCVLCVCINIRICPCPGSHFVDFLPPFHWVRRRATIPLPSSRHPPHTFFWPRKWVLFILLLCTHTPEFDYNCWRRTYLCGRIHTYIVLLNAKPQTRGEEN